MTSDELKLHFLVPYKRVVEVRQSPFIVGRASDCHLQLQFEDLSRHHARLHKDDEGKWVLCDLGSTNGTFRNRIPVGSKSVELHNGDTIVFGNIMTRVELCSTDKADDSHDSESSTGSYSVIGEARSMRERWLSAGGPGRQDTTSKRAIERLQYLVDLATLLSRANSIEAIFRSVVDIVNRDLKDIERLALLVDVDGSGELSPLCATDGSGGIVSEASWVSRSICENVFRQQVAIKTADAAMDERLEDKKSIIYKGIHGALAVPVWDEDHVMGVLYADATLPITDWLEGDEDDISFFSALGNLVAYSVKRSLLAEELKREEQIRNRLARYHSPAVVQQMLSEGSLKSDSLAPVDREISILFADLVGFTELSEILPPSEVADLLSTYFEEMLEEIFERSGTLDKFIGDCIMAFFGAPEVYDDHADRCIEAALGMLERLEKLNREGSLPHPLEVRIAINSGRAVVGDIGSAQRIEYTALGSSINLAARMEGICPSGSLVISQATYDKLSQPERFQPFDEYSFKGIKKPVKLYIYQDVD